MSPIALDDSRNSADAVADKPKARPAFGTQLPHRSVHILGTKWWARCQKERQLTGSDLVFEDARMSREHFKITLIDGFYVLDDLDSLNGTFVNDDPQPIKESVILRAGTMIRVEM